MTEKDLSRVETRLKITLPEEYRILIQARAAELEEAGCFNDELSTFFLDPEQIISFNKLERPKNSGTGYAFPKWWQTYFLVGTNGGGDYYCLRLDNKPGVWMIGSDCGDKPTRVARSLKAFVDKLVKKHQAGEALAARRQEVIQEEASEEMRAVAETGNEKAKEWLGAETPYPMFDLLDNLGRKLSPRKLRLFGIACCRRIANLLTDEDCRRAILLAEELVNGTADQAEVAGLRARMKSKYLAIVREREQSPAGLWGVGAARNLLQDDQDYLRDAPIFAGDADLLGVWKSAFSATSGDLAEAQAQADLLREVVGNPYCPVRFEQRWRTPAVVALARTIYETRDFDQMSALAEALISARCDDQRVLKHCRRKGGHVRGCWVLDSLLGLSDPEPQEQDFTWDFQWEHPKIDAGELKQRLQAFGIDAANDRKTEDEGAALAFADWLEANGDQAWANYIRVRCSLDGKAPGDDYPDLVEQYLESGAAMRPGRADFEGFYFSGYRFANEQWWGNETDDMERGLPSLVDAVKPGREAGPVAGLIKRLDALVRKTPVRGIDFEWHYPEEMAAILHSPGARHLRWMSFANRPAEGRPGPVIEALAQSPVVRTLERLDINEGVKSDADALSLANTSFKRLRRLDLHAYAPVICSAKTVTQLMTAPWFRKLERTLIGFSEDCCETGMLQLANMPRLHTLGLWIPPDRQIAALNEAGDFPALKRLFIHCANLTGKCREAFGRLRALQLMELWLRNSKAKTADVCALAATPLFDRLRVLTLDGTRIDEKGLVAVAASVCARELRILRISGGGDLTGGFRALAATPLTRGGTFPELTTLELKYPYAKKVPKDTAEFLKRAALPKLRHLTLDDCDFDDQCAEILGTRPGLDNLTRLVLERATLSRRAAEKLFRSPNLQRLVELRIVPPYGVDRAAFGKAVEVLRDPTVMPVLAGGWFSTSEVSEKTIEQLKAARPGLVISQ